MIDVSTVKPLVQVLELSEDNLYIDAATHLKTIFQKVLLRPSTFIRTTLENGSSNLKILVEKIGYYHYYFFSISQRMNREPEKVKIKEFLEEFQALVGNIKDRMSVISTANGALVCFPTCEEKCLAYKW